MARQVETSWYVVEVDDSWVAERTWKAALSKNGGRTIRQWIPRLVVRRLVNGTWIHADEPVLAGYVLLTSVLGWRHIEEKLGVELLRLGGKRPRPLSREELDWLREMESIERYELEHDLVPDQEVRVREDADSPWAGMTGIFDTLVMGKTTCYAKVFLTFWKGRRREIHLPYDHLEPSGGGKKSK